VNVDRYLTIAQDLKVAGLANVFHGGDVVKEDALACCSEVIELGGES
jgi:hypothetical protein